MKFYHVIAKYSMTDPMTEVGLFKLQEDAGKAIVKDVREYLSNSCGTNDPDVQNSFDLLSKWKPEEQSIPKKYSGRYMDMNFYLDGVEIWDADTATWQIFALEI